MGLNTNGKNALVNGLASVVTHVSVHSAIPDANGSGELTGGTYARVAVTWTSASNGVRDNNAQLDHNIPAGSTAATYGLWSALTVGTFYGYIPRTGTGEGLAGFGTVDSAGVTSDAIQSAAHGLSNGMRVVVHDVVAESLPTGLSEDTIYWVVQAATDTFELSATEGGSSVNITAQGELFWQRIVPEVFASAGVLSAATGAVDLSAAVI